MHQLHLEKSVQERDLQDQDVFFPMQCELVVKINRLILEEYWQLIDIV